MAEHRTILSAIEMIMKESGPNSELIKTKYNRNYSILHMKENFT